MHISTFKNFPCVKIDPGEFYVSDKVEFISTLLGSCVASCLYDPINGIRGMNHFLLAKKKINIHHQMLEIMEFIPWSY